jgi:hypothetical protein
MSVALRCPSCGTTKTTAGECEACHQAQVRYFCTNHTPGLWLYASTCPKCGARFGEPTRVSSSAPPTVRVPTRSRSAAHAPPASSPRPRVSGSRRMSGSGARSLPTEGELGPGVSRLAPWQKLILAALRARSMHAKTAAERERSRTGRGAGGCLVRFVLVIVVLFFALVSTVFLFGQTLLRF